jgi:hypothetical protein
MCEEMVCFLSNLILHGGWRLNFIQPSLLSHKIPETLELYHSRLSFQHTFSQHIHHTCFSLRIFTLMRHMTTGETWRRRRTWDLEGIHGTLQ